MTTTSPTAAITLRIDATMKIANITTSEYDAAAPQAVTVTARVATEEDARTIAALFPKTVGLRASGLVGSAEHTGYLHFSAKLLKDGVVGDRNETGLRRFARLIAKAAELGIKIEYRGTFANSYRTLDAFCAAAAIEVPALYAAPAAVATEEAPAAEVVTETQAPAAEAPEATLPVRIGQRVAEAVALAEGLTLGGSLRAKVAGRKATKDGTRLLHLTRIERVALDQVARNLEITARKWIAEGDRRGVSVVWSAQRLQASLTSTL
jgi:hypothetical protein